MVPALVDCINRHIDSFGFLDTVASVVGYAASCRCNRRMVAVVFGAGARAIYGGG